MNADAYRSYVVRVRRPRAARPNDDAVRIDVEDLLDGGRAVVEGDVARRLAEGLETMLENARPVSPEGPQPHE